MSGVTGNLLCLLGQWLSRGSCGRPTHDEEHLGKAQPRNSFSFYLRIWRVHIIDLSVCVVSSLFSFLLHVFHCPSLPPSLSIIPRLSPSVCSPPSLLCPVGPRSAGCCWWSPLRRRSGWWCGRCLSRAPTPSSMTWVGSHTSYGQIGCSRGAACISPLSLTQPLNLAIESHLCLSMWWSMAFKKVKGWPWSNFTCSCEILLYYAFCGVTT